jgi:hypothetical protein
MKSLACRVVSRIFGLDKEGQAVERQLPYTVVNWPQELAFAVELFDGEEPFLERFNRYEDAHNSKGQARRLYQGQVALYEEAAKAWPKGWTSDQVEDVLERITAKPEDREKLETVNLFSRGASPADEEIIEALREHFDAQFFEQFGSGGVNLSFGAKFTASKELMETAGKIAAKMLLADDSLWTQLSEGMGKRGYVRFQRIYGDDFSGVPSEVDEKLTEEFARWISFREAWETRQKKADDSLLLGDMM